MTYKFGQMLANYTLMHPNVAKLIKSNEKFDLIIMESFLNDAHLGNTSVILPHKTPYTHSSRFER